MTITFTELLEEHSDANGTTYITGSYVPTANRALLVFVSAHNTDDTTATGSGNGLTWTKELSSLWHSNGDTVFVFSALTGSSPTAGAFTFNCSANGATGTDILILEIDGCNLTDAIGQVVSAGGASGAPFSTTFSPAIASDSAVVSLAAEAQTSAANRNPPTGYTKTMQDKVPAGAVSSAYGAYHAAPGAVTTVSWATNATATWRAVGVEVKAAAGSGTITYTLARADGTDAAQIVSGVKFLGPSQALETEHSEKVLGFRVSDFSTGVVATITTDISFGITQVTETELAQAITRFHEYALGKTQEMDTAAALTGLGGGGPAPVDKTFITAIYRQIAKDGSKKDVLKEGHKDGIPNDGNRSNAIDNDGNQSVSVSRNGNHKVVLEKVASP